MKKIRLTSLILLLLLLSQSFAVSPAMSQEVPDEEETGSTANESTIEMEDYDKYSKYLQYHKYEKKRLYKKYSKAKKQFGFDSSSEKAKAKAGYAKYKLFKKDPLKYPQHAQFYKAYKKYSRYKKNVSPVRKYAKYKKYNKSAYDAYKNFGTAEYKAAHDRHNARLRAFSMNFGEANLGCGVVETGTLKCLGPLITVGLWSTSKTGSQNEPFKIDANSPYNIVNASGEVLNLEPIDGAMTTRVEYDTDGKLFIYSSDYLETYFSDGLVDFVAADGNTNIVFDVHRPSSYYDEYRYSMRIRYSDYSKQIWAINIVPMEQYVWGMGEIKGTGDMKYNEVMTISFRTYGYWKLKFSTAFAKEGFKVNATPGNQLYYGYTYEIGDGSNVVAHPRIKEGAGNTWGKLMMFNTGSLNEIAITPYSSWTDGRTRSFQERWGSTAYPWCKSVTDSYGKHATKSTSQLEAEGNHMVGLSANGALRLASDEDWAHEQIMKYYYSGVNFIEAYQLSL